MTNPKMRTNPVRLLFRPFSRRLSLLTSRLTSAGRAAVVMVFAGGACFAALGWIEALAGAALLSALLVGAVAMTRGGVGYEAAILPGATRMAVGERTGIAVRLRNPGTRPIGGATGLLTMSPGFRECRLPALKAGGTATVRLPFDATARAAVTVGPLTIRRGDPFGLARRDHRLAGACTMFVHPPVVPLVRGADAGVMDPDGEPDDHVMADSLEFHGLREYADGDDPHRVHWMASAKAGTLMVRQFAATRRADVELTLDTRPDAYAGPDEFELAVSVFASIGAQYLRWGYGVRAWAGSERLRAADAMSLLDMCSAIPPLPDPKPGAKPESGRPQASPHGHPGARASSPASLRCRVTGSRMPLGDAVRSMGTGPEGVIVRAHCRAAATVQWRHGHAVVVVGDLRDLGAAWTAWHGGPS